MEQCGKKPEFRLLNLETAAAFRNAALAKKDNLFTASKRIYDDSPFLERGAHRERLRASANVGNPVLTSWEFVAVQ